MKTLVLSMSTGQGHYAAAKAIQDTFIEMGAECEVLDAYEYIQPLLSDLVSKGYLISTAYAKRLSGIVYDYAVKKDKPVAKYSVPKIANTLWAKELEEYIDAYKPDIIICTHVFPASMVNIMKERNWNQAITVGIVTDFTVHPLWEETRLLDYYVTPSKLLASQMIRKGLDVHKVLPYGIPVKKKFNQKMDQKEARIQLGLDADKTTILLMSGSMGYGDIGESIEKLDSMDLDFQTIVVCGNSKRRYRKASKMKTSKRFDIHGFVDNVDVMMDAADFIITKPGGITTSEALSKELPMVMVNPIPGQEVRNAELLLNLGLAMYATDTLPLEDIVFALIKYPEILENIHKNIKLFGRKNASERLYEFLAEKVRD